MTGSIPSSGTNLCSGFVNGEKQNPPLIITSEVVAALANAGKALQLLASALAGPSGRFPETFRDKLIFQDALTCTDVINELLKAKGRAGKSDSYLKLLRSRLRSFAQGMKNRPLQDVLPQEIERWLDTAAIADRTKRNRLECARLLFNFAQKRSYVRSNAAAAIELAQMGSNRPPAIHSPADVKKVLDAMREKDLNICRILAIRYFAGLRTEEAKRLSEEEIKIERGFIEVTAAKAKTRRRRLVTIQPNLKAWLSIGGELPVTDFHTRMARVSKLAGVEWPANVARHSFVSYHLAKFQNAGKTALEAGHSEQMLFQHYREIVTPEEAERFFGIFPD
jgi:integrase